MSETIALDAAEFLDRLEDQLAWLAVAGSVVHDYVRRTRLTFFTEHFRCAEPWLSLGGEETAKFVFDGVPCVRQGAGRKGILESLPRERKGDLLRRVLQALRRPLRFAEIREEPALRTPLLGDLFLHSVGLLPSSDVARRGPSKGMRRLWHQYISIATDRPPTDRDVLTYATALRADSGEIINEQTGRPDAETLLDGLIWSAIGQGRREQEWTVEISLSRERTGLAIGTDAVGARDLLKSLGRTPNRRALVHWVRAHYRRKRDGVEATFVREHLRGTQLAMASHLFATVRPSVVDIDRACNGKRFDVEAS